MNFKPLSIYSALKIDKRGRVRFGAQGYRFEVTERGIRTYLRKNLYGQSEPACSFPVSQMDKNTVRTLAKAIDLVHS